MKNQEAWVPTKFVFEHGRLRASRDPRCVSIASRLNVDLLAVALQRLLSRFATGQLLDLGCGNVPLYAVYAPHVTGITCVDWENSVHSGSYLDVSADLNQPLPLEAASFDTVLLSDVLEHIAQPELLLSEVRRVLKPGGVLVGSVPFLYRLHEQPHDYFRYTEYALREMAHRHSLEAVVLEAYGCGTDVLFDILGKAILGWQAPLAPRLTSMTQAVGWSLHRSRIGVKLNARQQEMVLGYVFAMKAS